MDLQNSHRTLAQALAVEKASSLVQREPDILYAIGHTVDRRLQGRDVVWEVQTSEDKASAEHCSSLTDFQARSRLHRAVAHPDSKEFKNLGGKSNLAAQTFTQSAVEIFNGSIDTEARHKGAHLEYRMPKLLRDALALEVLRARDFKGDLALCPQSIALRFLLVALGPAEVGRLLEEIRRDSHLYESLDETQIRDLKQYIESS